MEQWYALKTATGKEEAAEALLKQKVNNHYWSECRVLKKMKVFRSGGVYHLIETTMFPGYLFIKTGCSRELSKELAKSGDFPQPVQPEMVPLEEEGLRFLKSVCGENLEKTMGLTRISLNRDNKILKADGALSGFLNQIVKLNLHKRFALVKVELFNREQDVLFGLQLQQDRVG